MRPYVGGQSEVAVHGKTAGEAVESLLQQYPALRPHLTREDGRLRAFVNVFLGEDNVRDLEGLKTPVGDEENIRLVLSIAGG